MYSGKNTDFSTLGKSKQRNRDKQENTCSRKNTGLKGQHGADLFSVSQMTLLGPSSSALELFLALSLLKPSLGT